MKIHSATITQTTPMAPDNTKSSTPVEELVSSGRFIPKSSQMGYNQLYLDFLQNNESARALYPDSNVESVAKAIDGRDYDREALATILEKQCELFGAKPKALANIKRLRQPDSLVVSSGQQAGLFGGPLLGFYKAIWAVKMATDLEKKLDRPVIPIFWIAADDHDFQEINHTYTFDILGEPVQRSYYRVENEGRPAYDLHFTDEEVFAELRASLTDSLGRTDFSEELLERLFSAYHIGADFVTAFGKFFTDSMPDNGLIAFSPGDDDFKRLAAPFYHQTLDNHFQLKKELSDANVRILSAGYHLQVQKEESACHLFLLDPDRKAIHLEGDNYKIGERSYSETELKNLINLEPARFSPDVLTRPALSASVFPVVVQGGGPSEVAYFAQLWPLFKLYDIPVPIFSGRVSLTLIEKRFEKLLNKHGLEFLDFCGDIESVINEALGKTFPQDLEESFTKLKASVRTEFSGVAKQVIKFDNTLERNSEQILGKLDHAISAFEKKTFSSHKKKLADERAALYRAGNSLFPRHGLQERTLGAVYYLSRYGYAIMDYISDSLELDINHHQLLYLAEMDKK